MQNVDERAIAQGEELELSPEAVRVLVRMRAILQRDWIRGFYRTDYGGRCLMGALDTSFEGWAAHWQTIAALGREAGFPERDCSRLRLMLVVWNDAPGRTREEVLRLIDGILARVRK